MNFPRELFDKSWFDESVSQLTKTFEEFRPRSAFVSNKSSIEKNNVMALDPLHEQPNIISYKTRFWQNNVENINSFDDIFAGNSKFNTIKQKLESVENYIAQFVESAQSTFLTFSTNITGAQIGVKHLHSLMNKDRCNVWSFCIPLYIDNEHLDKNPGFYLTSQTELFPKRWYIDYSRIKAANFTYGSFNVPLHDKVFSIRFDGSRSPHYINYTPHVFVWFVFDGVEYKDLVYRPNGIQFLTELL